MLAVGVSLLTLTAAAMSSAGASALQPDAVPRQDGNRPTYDLFPSADPDRPGVGVSATEEVVVSGGEAPGSAPAPSESGPAGGGGAPAGRPQQCNTYTHEPRLDSVVRSLAPFLGRDSAGPVDNLEVGRTYGRECRYADDGSLAFIDDYIYAPTEPGATPDGAEPVAIGPSVDVIARQVYAEIPLVLPVPHTSPPAGSPQLVGLPVWLWLDDSSWATFDASASVAGVTVTVVATPRRASWNMGDGTTVTCTEAGTPWTGDATATTNCSHTYQHVSDDEPGGRYQADVTLTWSVSWSASTGETGTLPEASRTTDFELDVRQRQAVITRDR